MKLWISGETVNAQAVATQLVGFELRIVVNPTLFGRCEIVDGWRIMQREWTSSMVDHIFAASLSCHSIELGPSQPSRIASV